MKTINKYLVLMLALSICPAISAMETKHIQEKQTYNDFMKNLNDNYCDATDISFYEDEDTNSMINARKINMVLKHENNLSEISYRKIVDLLAQTDKKYLESLVEQIGKKKIFIMCLKSFQEIVCGCFKKQKSS
jgi:hypothetical protein